MNLKGRHLISLKDYTKEEILYLIDLANKVKNEKKSGHIKKKLKGKNIALIFEKPSTRTRCAFTVACVDEGAHGEYLGKNDIQLGHKESIEDTARVLGRYFDGIQFSGFKQETVEKLAKYSGVPVWNGLTDLFHPTQVLADLLTIKEHVGTLEEINMVYMGDGRNNMANSLMIGAAKVGINFTIIGPKELWPEEELLEECKKMAKSKIEVTENIENYAKGAQVIYTDVWCSMGEEHKSKERIELLKDYQVTEKIMDMNKSYDTIFMHCLPAVRGNEVAKEVIDGHKSVVFDQAENRMHTIKAVMVATLVKKEEAV
jgi:ornithine carbamoyltransferase